MREIFKGRIKWIILIGIFMIGISITLAVILNNSNKKHDSKDNSKFTTDVKEKLERDKDLEMEEQKVEDKEDKSIDVVEKETTINNTSKNNDKNSSSTNSKSNNSVSNNKNNTNNNSDKTSITNNSNSNTNINTNTNSNSNSNNTETPKQDPPINKPSEDLTKIANPNDFFYSITGGNVEFSTNAGCMKAGEDIAFIDVVDVQYFRCYEVMSKANTIMGYYLNIFCENGNCNNRYKSMINISNYD